MNNQESEISLDDYRFKIVDSENNLVKFIIKGDHDALKSFTQSVDAKTGIKREKIIAGRKEAYGIYEEITRLYKPDSQLVPPESIFLAKNIGHADGYVISCASADFSVNPDSGLEDAADSPNKEIRFMLLKEKLFNRSKITRRRKVIAHESVHMIQSRNCPSWLRELTADYFAIESGYRDNHAKLETVLLEILGNRIVSKLSNLVGEEKFKSAVFADGQEEFVRSYDEKNGIGSFKKLDETMDLQNRFRDTDLKLLRLGGLNRAAMFYLRLQALIKH